MRIVRFSRTHNQLIRRNKRDSATSIEINDERALELSEPMQSESYC